MKIFIQVLAGLGLIFTLCSYLPIPLLPFIPLALSLIFIIPTLLIGLFYKDRLIWVGSLAMLISAPISLSLQEQRSAQYLFDTCKQFILEGRWQISDYIIEKSNLAYIYNSDAHDNMVAELQRISSVAKQVEATASACGSSPEKTKELITLAVLKEISHPSAAHEQAATLMHEDLYAPPQDQEQEMPTHPEEAKTEPTKE